MTEDLAARRTARNIESELLAGCIHHPRLVLVRGAGSYVWDVDGRRYLDFTAGLGVAALGHGRADLAEVLRDQFATLGHVSNLYGNLPALELARRLVETSFAARIWFANSGTEANEAAIKFARLHGRAAGGARKVEIVAFRGGFHGRTLGALAATHHPAYRQPFAPLVPGVRFARFNDLESVRRVVSARTAAVLVEPVQGEGGVVPARAGFLEGLRELCRAHDALLVYDEVQCGLGRLGSLYAYQDYGVVPDMLTLAKPLAGGLPLGAVLLDDRVASLLRPGQHGSTFSGGPAVCAVGVRVFDAVSRPDFLAAAGARATRLRAGLEALAAASPALAAARGRGLMQALVLAPRWVKRAGDVVQQARARGLLVTRAGADAIRLLPPLTASDAEVDEALALLATSLDAIAPRRRPAAALYRPTETPGGGPQ
jgi:predicted acetylornithine/succinylornithine family transaminase